MSDQGEQTFTHVRCEIISANSTDDAAQNTTLTAYHPRNHPLDCTYHVDQYPHECTCGLLNNSDEIISNVRCEKINDPMTPAPQGDL